MTCRIERCNRMVCRGLKSFAYFYPVESLQTYMRQPGEHFMTDPGDRLHEAIKADSVSFASWALRSGKAQFALTKVIDGHVALHEAAIRGKLDMVRLLLSEKLAAAPDLDARTWKSDYTPLMVAVDNGHAAVVELLARAGADLDAQTHRKSASEASRGHAALHRAARRADPNLLHLLLLLGARPDLRTARGETADDVARRHRRPTHRRILHEFARHPRLNIPRLVFAAQPQLVVGGVLNLPLGLLQ
jgi:ankyrin repeat protein